jgi:hypothetical protein
MIAIGMSDNELRHKWRQQILSHCNPQYLECRKGFVALTFVDQSKTSSEYVDINNLLVALLYEDGTHCSDHRSLRLSGYGVSRVPDGVQWGGAESCRLHIDLTLAPQHGARGQRLDCSKHDLLALALKLDRRLTRAGRYPAAPWPGLRLPPLWAGFRARHAVVLRADARNRAVVSPTGQGREPVIPRIGAFDSWPDGVPIGLG